MTEDQEPPVHEGFVRQLDAGRGRIEAAAEVPEENPGEEDPDDDDPPAPSLRAIAVDGKSLRGAVQDDGWPVHLLAALTHTDRVVVAQAEVDHKEKTDRAGLPISRRIRPCSPSTWMCSHGMAPP